MGLELDEPRLGAFAGSLNALDFPVQLLVRQHPPVLSTLRNNLDEAQPEDLPQQTKDAADSLGRLLTTLETREGILDRRFYAVCEHGRMDELHGLLVRGGLGVFPLAGEPLRLFWLSAALGGSPVERDEEAQLEVEVNRRDIRIGNRLVRSLHLGKWPRSLAPGFLQGLMATGAPMDLSVHLGAIPAEQAARTLEWQKVRFESAQSLSFKRGRSLSPEAEIALEDVSRLRDEVQRGRERLFHASLSVTLHADNADTLKDLTQKARAHFAATLGKLDNLAFRQREGCLSTLPLGAERRGGVAHPGHFHRWRDCFPFSPPDLDTRSGTLYGIDLRACAPIVYDPFDGTHLNANTAVLARSGSGKSFATKLGVLRGLCRGVRAYVIDPEGEYADMARAAGGRVLSPGVPGQGMNPFVIDRGDSEELLQRIGSLRRLIEVMVGERLSAERRSSLDHALASYYAQRRERTGFRDFYAYLQEETPEIAHLLRPFATGSLRDLLSDEGDDLLAREALVTVFDLHLLEPELQSRRRDGLHRNGVGGSGPGPKTPAAGGGRGVERSCSTPRARPSWSQWRNAPASTGWACSSSPRTCRTSSPRILQEQSPAIPAAPFCRTRHSSCCSSRTPPPFPPWGKPSTCRWSCNAGSCPVREATVSCWQGATASPSASRPRRRRPRSSSGAPAPGTSDSKNDENEANGMNLNFRKLLFGDGRNRRPPVLLAVTPPRAGERTLLGVENLLQSIAVPEPFSLEIAGDMDGVTLLARCQDDRVVRGQIAAHYPQARINEISPEDDPLQVLRGRAGVGDDPAGRRPGVRAPANIPGRRPAGPRLRSPHRPDGGALGPLPGGAGGGAAAAALPGTRLVPATPGPRPQGGRPREPRTLLHLPDQAAATGRRDHGRAGRRGSGGPPGLPVDTGRGVPQGVAAGLQVPSSAAIIAGWGWWRWKQARSRVHDPMLIREKVSRIAFDAELQVVAVLPAGTGPQRAKELLEPVAAAYRHYDHPAGARFKVSGVRPLLPTDNLHPTGPGLFGKRSVLGVREVACLWHPPGAGDETPLVERSGSRALLPSAKGVRGGALVGDTTAGAKREIRFPEDLLRRHHLYVARTRMGKSTLMHHVVTHKLQGESRGPRQRRHRGRGPPRRPGGRHPGAGAGIAHRQGTPDRPGRPDPLAGHQPAGHPRLPR